MFGSADLEELGDGIPPWPQALGKSISDSWCLWEVRGHSKASRVQGELANGERTPVVASEPMQTKFLNFCTFLPIPGLQNTSFYTKQEHPGRLAHILHSPTCCLAAPAPVPILQLTDCQFRMFHPPIPPLTHSPQCLFCPMCTLIPIHPLSSPLYCLSPSCLTRAGLSIILAPSE